MSGSLLVGLAATAVLLGLAARAAEEVLRSYGRATRWVWVAAIGASALLPLVAAATGGAALWNWLPRPAPPDLSALLEGATVVNAAVPAASAEAGIAWDRVLIAAWAAASLIALGVYGATWRRLRRSRRRWSPAELAGTSVYVSARGGPAVVGVLRPSIVVPEWLLAEGEAAQRIVLLHEQEHVRAYDPALLAAAPLAVAAMPWNLALWWQLRRLRLAIELDCDRRVLARGVDPASYGSLLLDIAGRGGPALAGAASIAEPRTFLERRILAMSSTIPRLRFARSLALSGIAAVFALIACETAGPTAVNTPAPQPEPEVDVVEAVTALELTPAGKPSPLIIVDGLVVDASLSETGAINQLVDPAAIDHIEVIKGAAAAELYGERARDGVILITTVASGRARPAGAASEYTLSEKRTAEVNAVLRAKADGRVISVKPLEKGVVLGRAGGAQAKIDAEKQATALIRQVGEAEAAAVRAKRVEAVTALDAKSSKPLIANGIVKRADQASATISGKAQLVRPKSGEVVATAVGGERVKILENSAAVIAKGGVVRLRGQAGGEYTYIASPGEPIFFVDGVRVNDLEIEDLDPERIERIEVVKGAAARALYGPTAANGVIRITTKR
jgi:TonB-dependent SusC/RagA subfamily outer membrane receptor